MAIYMPPLARKKQVQGRYNPDSFRVISTFAEETHQKYQQEQTENISEWRKQWRENKGLALPDIYNRKTEVLPHEAPDYRIHKPHPGSCGFLRHNVRLLNEPICTVFTEVTRSEQQNWWPSRISTEPLHVPPQTKDTIYRADFQQREKTSESFGSFRHTANPYKDPALGTVPVNFLAAKDGQQRFFKEKISYEHQYNSRFADNYPIRGKRHGSFVWDQMNQDATKKFIDHYKVISPEEGIVRQLTMEAEKKVRESSEISKLLTEEQTEKSSSLKVEPVVADLSADTSMPKVEPLSPKTEPTAFLSEPHEEPPTQKLASPHESKKSSPKGSPLHSPMQKTSPKHSPQISRTNSNTNDMQKTSPKHSQQHSRINSNTDNNPCKSPPKSPVGNAGTKLIEEINNFLENGQNKEGDQSKTAESISG